LHFQCYAIHCVINHQEDKLRPLTSREIESVSGAETIHYQLPAGVTISTRLERNQSTSITFRGLPGIGTYTWNSGTFVSCYTIAGGLGLIAGTLSANPLVGLLTRTLVTAGCSALATNNPVAYELLRLHTESITVVERVVANTLKAFTATKSRYESGVGSMIELIKSQSDLVDARQQALSIRAEWQAAKMKTAILVGELERFENFLQIMPWHVTAEISCDLLMVAKFCVHQAANSPLFVTRCFYFG